MAYKWIIGDFATGTISEANELPVVLNKGDKISVDVNGDESATLTLSMRDLPSDWRTYLSPVNKMVAYVDTDSSWLSGVIWAGFINKVSASVNDTVKVQAAGLKEYMKVRSTNNVFGSTNTNPKAAINFTGTGYRQLMRRIIEDCFSTTGIPSSSPRPPQVLIGVSGLSETVPVSYSVPVNDGEFYANILDTMRDELSDAGQEYYFNPRWRDSTKTRIGWIGYVMSSTNPHRNESTTLTIDLGDGNNGTYKPTAFGQNASSDNMVSRIIGISKEGDDKTPSDLTTKTTRTYTSILIDEFWNPGVELTSSQLNTQLNERLSYNSQTFKESNFTTVFDDKSYIKTHLNNLGRMAAFTSSGNIQNFGLTMRIVGVSISYGGNTAEIELAPKAARYPRLPKDNKNLKPKTERPKTGRPKTGPGGLPGNYGDYVKPITPSPKPGHNGTTPIPGGVITPDNIKDIVDGIIKPDGPGTPGVDIPENPFQPPDNDTPNIVDAYEEEDPIIETIDIRSFKNVHQLGSMNWNESNISQFGHAFPDLTRARFNHSNGKLIGVNKSAIGGDIRAGENPPVFGYYDIDVYEIDTVGMFNRDSNPYMNETYNATPPNPADDFKLKVGSISYGMYSNLYVSYENFKAQLPPAESDKSEDIGKKYSQISRAWDYNFFCSADHQTVYVQVLYTIGRWQVDKNSVIPDMKKSYSITNSKVFKGVRNSEGIVELWEDLSDALTDRTRPESPYVFFSPNIYDINGQFKAFGGYYIPLREDGILIFNGLLPDYALKFYGQGITNIPRSITGFTFNQTEFELKDVNRVVSAGKDPTLLDNVKVPYAVNVDYGNNKVILGFSKGVKNRSMFYEADFSNLTSYRKIMNTDRESTYPYLGFDTGTDDNNDMVPDKLPPTDPFSLSSRAPIKYKNNYIQFEPEGINISRQPSTPDNYTDKKIKWVRGKDGFDDTVKGELPFLMYNRDNGTTFKNAYPIHNTAMSNGNLLNAFRGYIGKYAHITAEYYNNLTGNNKLPKPYGGFEYFYYDGFLYIFCDNGLNPQDDLNRWDNGSEGRTNLHSRYWVGKFRFIDEKLK